MFISHSFTYFSEVFVQTIYPFNTESFVLMLSGKDKLCNLDIQ